MIIPNEPGTPTAWTSACSPEKLPPPFKQREFDPFDTSLYPKGFPSDPELLYRIFNFSDETRTIFHRARNRRPKAVNPIGLLMRELIRRGRRCPVDVRWLPGTPKSTYVVVVGRSGTGKSEAAKPDASPWPDLSAPKWLEDLAAKKIPAEPSKAPKAGAIATPSSQPILIPYDFDKTESIGSGQALTDFLITLEGKGDNVFVQMLPHPSVLIEEDEMMTLFRAAKAQASTIIPTLNSGWTGAAVGNNTRTHGDRRTTGKYDVYLWAGLQLKFAHELLDQDDSGFFQRTFLCPVTDPYRHIQEPRIPKPRRTTARNLTFIREGDAFTLDPDVEAEIYAANDDSDFDHLPNPEDEAKSHAGQVRIRIAQLGALMHGTLHISAELWAWTADLMEVCDRVDAWMRAEADRNRAAVAEQKGADLAQMQASAEATKADRTFDAIAAGVKALEAKGMGPESVGLSGGRIRNCLSSSSPLKKFLTNKALDEACAAGRLQVVPGTRRYRLAPEVPVFAPAPAPAPAPGGGIATPGQAAAPAPATETPAPAPTTAEAPAPTAEAPAPETPTTNHTPVDEDDLDSEPFLREVRKGMES
jgi:hypothetical protein